MHLPIDSSAVTPRYGVALAGLRWHPVASAGFSGACVWRGDDTDGTPHFALKAYPPDAITTERLNATHAWLHAASNLSFVPELIPTRDGNSFTRHDNRLWEVVRWMPGQADFHSNPARLRLEAACIALARLHCTWRPMVATHAVVPGVLRRLIVFDDFQRLSVEQPVEPVFEVPLRRGRELVRRLIPAATQALAPWATRRAALQPCLCDIWHDHVLLTGDEVTGIIDFGSMKIDHVAVDLARLLGSLVPGDVDAWTAGLEAYRRVDGVLDVGTWAGRVPSPESDARHTRVAAHAVRPDSRARSR